MKLNLFKFCVILISFYYKIKSNYCQELTEEIDHKPGILKLLGRTHGYIVLSNDESSIFPNLDCDHQQVDKDNSYQEKVKADFSFKDGLLQDISESTTKSLKQSISTTLEETITVTSTEHSVKNKDKNSNKLVSPVEALSRQKGTLTEELNNLPRDYRIVFPWNGENNETEPKIPLKEGMKDIPSSNVSLAQRDLEAESEPDIQSELSGFSGCPMIVFFNEVTDAFSSTLNNTAGFKNYLVSVLSK